MWLLLLLLRLPRLPPLLVLVLVLVLLVLLVLLIMLELPLPLLRFRGSISQSRVCRLGPADEAPRGTGAPPSATAPPTTATATTYARRRFPRHPPLPAISVSFSYPHRSAACAAQVVFF